MCWLGYWRASSGRSHQPVGYLILRLLDPDTPLPALTRHPRFAALLRKMNLPE
jgi:hypothetical protein